MPNLAIFYPNGQVEACQMYIWDGSKPILWDGSVTVSVTSSGTAIEDGVDNSIKATVRESSATAGKFILAVGNPDGSNIGAITGYATSAKQDTGNTSLASIDTKLTSPVTVTGPLTDTQLRATAVPISAAALPLPSGAATESTLSSLNSKVTAVNTGAVVLAAGSAIIGKVGIDQTTPGTTNGVQVNAALPAGTNLLGQVAASNETNTLYNGTTALTPKFAKIAASSSGDNTLVSAVTSKKIRVLAYNFIANGTVNAKFQSGASGTDLTGLKYCIVNMGICAPYNPLGWFESASGVLLNLNLSAGVAVGGELVYVEV